MAARNIFLSSSVLYGNLLLIKRLIVESSNSAYTDEPLICFNGRLCEISICLSPDSKLGLGLGISTAIPGGIQGFCRSETIFGIGSNPACIGANCGLGLGGVGDNE